jgi:hypothetical protein
LETRDQDVSRACHAGRAKDETAHALLEAVKAVRWPGSRGEFAPLLYTLDAAYDAFLAAHPSGEEQVAALRASSAPSDDERCEIEYVPYCLKHDRIASMGDNGPYCVSAPVQARR